MTKLPESCIMKKTNFVTTTDGEAHAVQDLNFAQMQKMQKELQEKYKAIWRPDTPENGARQLLWMYGEMAEVADVIKKKGEAAIMDDPQVRRHFVEEMCDVMMYFSDVMLCFGVTPEELTDIYVQKHERNMNRW